MPSSSLNIIGEIHLYVSLDNAQDVILRKEPPKEGKFIYVETFKQYENSRKYCFRNLGFE